MLEPMCSRHQFPSPSTSTSLTTMHPLPCPHHTHATGSQPPLVFLQQRAPAALGRQAAFAAELVTWLHAAGAAGVVVLTGLDAQLRRDRQLDSSPFRSVRGGQQRIVGWLWDWDGCATGMAGMARGAEEPKDWR